MTEEARTQQVLGLTTKLRIAGAVDTAPVVDALTRIMMEGARQAGFWSAEIIPPSNAHPEWTLVERFRSSPLAMQWMESQTRKSMFESLRALVPGRILTTDELGADKEGLGTVATAVVTYVKPGMEEMYWQWEERIQSAQARFPGYRGTYIEPPPPDSPGTWTTMLRFDSPESLDAWLSSEERRRFLLEAQDLVKTTQFQDMSSSFPGWFPSDKSGQSPPVWKTAMLVLIGIFPVVIALKSLLLPLMKGLNLTLVIVTITALSVSVLSWVCMPVLIRAFRWWLLPERANAKALSLRGAALTLAILILQIILFWGL